MRHGYGEWKDNEQVVVRKERSTKKNRSDRMRKFDKRRREEYKRQMEELRAKAMHNEETEHTV